MSISHVRHLHTQFIASKITIGKMPKTWVVNITFSFHYSFCSISFYSFSSFFRDFWKSFKKWTLILFKLQKNYIVLVDEWNELYVHRTRTRSHHCVWNSNINVRCSKFDMLGEQRRILNVIYFIGIFFAISFLPDTDRLHLCMCAIVPCNGCAVPTCTLYDNPKCNGMWASLSL